MSPLKYASCMVLLVYLSILGLQWIVPLKALRRSKVSIWVHPPAFFNMHHIICADWMLTQVLLHSGGYIALYKLGNTA